MLIEVKGSGSRGQFINPDQVTRLEPKPEGTSIIFVGGGSVLVDAEVNSVARQINAASPTLRDHMDAVSGSST